jgi:hypothetical protein
MTSKVEPHGRIVVVINKEVFVEDVRTDDPRLEDVTVLVFSRADEDQK